LGKPFNFFLFSFLILSQLAFSQSGKPGSWGIATIVLPVNTEHRWGGYVEAQVRTDEELFKKFYYYELKTGISYAITNNATALLGTGRYDTYDYTDLDKGAQTKERRLWEQMTFSQYLSRIKVEHRYRIEQRWLNGNYRNRFRYRLNLVAPINHKDFSANTLFVSVFNEIFFNNKQPNFERNRVSTSLGYQLTSAIAVQAGWLNQYNILPADVTNNKNNLTINFTYQISRRRKELPTIKD